MIRIRQIKLPVQATINELKKQAAAILRLSEKDILDMAIVRRSLDAREKGKLYYVYAVEVLLKEEIEKRLKIRKSHNQIEFFKRSTYVFPFIHNGSSAKRPVIVGAGPAGLFCALFLSRAGFRPILLERGEAVEERKKSVEDFWNSGRLKEESNVQFGEGGAGTFSDGKLNTLIKDKRGLSAVVLKTFIEKGGDPSIAYLAKPHLGTDVMVDIVKNIRLEILENGGDIYYNSKVTGLKIIKEQIHGLVVNGTIVYDSNHIILAVGHSARDTFDMLYEAGIPVQPKAFAVGLRIEHRQEMINTIQYGPDYPDVLPPADYKLTAKAENGHGVYSFCMCPGGYVVDASSEPGRLAVNGMSYHDRAGVNANSAIVVTVSPDDFTIGSVTEKERAFSGMAFQRKLEEAAWKEGNGRIPVQRFEDFKNNRETLHFGTVTPEIRGLYQAGNLRNVIPSFLSESIISGMQAFGRKMPGFDDPDAVLSGVESRTSSPIRITRNEQMESSIVGLYPCGEGAGYAGGIMSAAIDGIKAAEKIAEKLTM